MNTTQLAATAGAVTIVVLSYKLASRNRRLKTLIENHNKLVEWSSINQRLMLQTVKNNPGLNLNMSQDLATDLDFFNLMNAENLL